MTMKNKNLLQETFYYMKERKQFILLLIFLLLFLSFSLAEVIDSPYEHYSLDSGYTAMTGYKFNMLDTKKLTQVWKVNTTTTINKVYILDENKNILISNDTVGDVAYFDYVLSNGKTYYVAFDRNGSSYDVYRNLTASYPVTIDFVNYIAGLRQSGGLPQDTASFGYNLDYMVFENVTYYQKLADSIDDDGDFYSNDAFSSDGNIGTQATDSITGGGLGENSILALNFNGDSSFFNGATYNISASCTGCTGGLPEAEFILYCYDYSNLLWEEVRNLGTGTSINYNGVVALDTWDNTCISQTDTYGVFSIGLSTNEPYSTFSINDISLNIIGVINTAPTIQSILKNDTFVYEEDILFTLNYTDLENDSSIYWYVDDILLQVNDSNFLFESNNFSSGIHQVYATINDSVGGDTSSILEVIIDRKNDVVLTYNDFEMFIPFDSFNSTQYDDYLFKKDLEVFSGIPTSDEANINDVTVRTQNFNYLYGKNSTVMFWVNVTTQNNFMTSGISTTVNPRTIVQSRSTYLLNSCIGSSCVSPKWTYGRNHVAYTFYNGGYYTYINGEIVEAIDDDNFMYNKSLSFNPFLNGDSSNSFMRFGDVAGFTLNDDIYIDDLIIANKALDSQQINIIMNDAKAYFDTLDFPPTTVLISSPTGTHTLNSTGKDFNFTFTQANGNPTPKYDVYLTNGVINFTIVLNTSLTNFTQSISKNQVSLSDSYNIIVEAFNTQGNSILQSSYQVNLCINQWTPQYSTCTNDTQIKTYYDVNLCTEQYDFPLDNGTSVSCDDGVLSSSELDERNLQFKENLMVTILLALITLVLIVFYMVTRSSLVGFILTIYFVLVSIYLFYQYPNDWIVGVAGLVVASAFAIASIYMNNE